MKQNDGGPAFPQGHAVGEISKMEGGMSLRDYFAAKALQGLCADPSTAGTEGIDLANECYSIADAMLAARES